MVRFNIWELKWGDLIVKLAEHSANEAVLNTDWYCWYATCYQIRTYGRECLLKCSYGVYLSSSFLIESWRVFRNKLKMINICIFWWGSTFENWNGAIYRRGIDVHANEVCEQHYFSELNRESRGYSVSNVEFDRINSHSVMTHAGTFHLTESQVALCPSGTNLSSNANLSRYCSSVNGFTSVQSVDDIIFISRTYSTLALIP